MEEKAKPKLRYFLGVTPCLISQNGHNDEYGLHSTMGRGAINGFRMVFKVFTGQNGYEWKGATTSTWDYDTTVYGPDYEYLKAKLDQFIQKIPNGLQSNIEAWKRRIREFEEVKNDITNLGQLLSGVVLEQFDVNKIPESKLKDLKKDAHYGPNEGMVMEL